jgi:rSAM/selenodomain-associated transferase 2
MAVCIEGKVKHVAPVGKGNNVISVIIPTLNAETGLAAAMTALIPAVVDGLVRDVIVVDGGSSDRTINIAEASGATLVRSAAGRGQQLIAGAQIARGPWLLFLHADTVLDVGWERDAAVFIEQVEAGKRPPAAAAFRFAMDDLGFWPRLVEWGVALRCVIFHLPYGDQGLLISQRLYNSLDGFRPMPLLEDVDLVGRLGRSRMVVLRSRAITSAVRYRRDGYPLRICRNLWCRALYRLRVSPDVIEKIYS